MSEQDQTINTYDIGDRPTLRGTFRDPETDALVDPDTVICRVKDPTGAFSTPVAASVETGKWTAQYTITMAGPHFYRFEGTGAVVAAGEKMFRVAKSEFEAVI